MTRDETSASQGDTPEMQGAAIHPDQLNLLFGGMAKGVAYCHLVNEGDTPLHFIALYANAALGKLCNQTDTIGSNISTFLSGTNGTEEELIRILHRVVHQGEVASIERYISALDKWLQIDVHRTNPGHFMLIVSKVSGKSQIELEVSENEQRLRAIFDSCPVPFCLNDTVGNITFLNRAFQKTFGYTVEDIPTLEAWWPQAYPDLAYREWVGRTWLSKVEKARSEGSEFETMEAVIRCKDGGLRTVLADAVPLGSAYADTHLVVLYDISDQKNAEKSQAKAELRAIQVLESVGDGLCQVNVDGYVTFINPRGAELLGYTPAEVIGRHAHTLFHHSHADGSPYPVSQCVGRQAMRMGRALSVDNEVFWRKDGSSFEVHYTVAPMTLDGIAQGEEVLTFRDTSEEHRIRQALLDNGIFMRKAQEIAGFGTYVLDMRTGLWESSPKLDELFGIDSDFVRDVTSWTEMVDEEYRQLAADHFHLVASGKIDFRLDYRITRPSDGAKRWVAGNGEVEFDAEGVPARLIGSIQDITNRKRIEADLQESHDLLQKVSKELPGVLYQFKMVPNGGFSVPFASMGSLEMFGLSQEDVQQDANRVFGAVVPEARDAFVQSILHSARTLENWVQEFEVELPGIGRRWRQGQARPELLEDGSVVWYGFINDSTERVESRRQLQQLNESLESRVLDRTSELVVALDSAEVATRSRGQFLANMSHEIRTPMNAIIGMVYLLLRNSPTAQQREYLNKIKQSGAHLLSIINDILDFSKIDAGKLQLDMQSHDLVQLLQQLVYMSEGKVNEKGLLLTLQIAPDVSRFVRCDALRLRQILINFLNNASKFTENGHITLRLVALNDPLAAQATDTCFLRFEVEDTGIGMNDEQLARLFQSFTQGDNSTTRKYGGTGLGLAISRQLATLMGGEVGVTSELNAGSTFWFTCHFDVAKEQSSEDEMAEDPERAAAKLRGKLALVVDDNQFNLEVAFDILSSIGMQVVTAVNGLQALERLHEQHFDIVLMDVQMPAMNGYEAARRIRNDAALASTVVIAMTANVSAEDRNLCLAAGMDAVLPKPIDPDQMFVTMANWIDAPRQSLATRPVKANLVDTFSMGYVVHKSSTETDTLPVQILPVWDDSALQRVVGNNVETRTRLLDKYLLIAGDTMASLRDAADAAQWSVVAELAHKLKSSSRTIGAMQLGSLCEQLEQAGRVPSGGISLQLAELVIQGFKEFQDCIKAR
jgi:PAS domain S-box-containing protein